MASLGNNGSSVQSLQSDIAGKRSKGVNFPLSQEENPAGFNIPKNSKELISQTKEAFRMKKRDELDYAQKENYQETAKVAFDKAISNAWDAKYDADFKDGWGVKDKDVALIKKGITEMLLAKQEGLLRASEKFVHLGDNYDPNKALVLPTKANDKMLDAIRDTDFFSYKNPERTEYLDKKQKGMDREGSVINSDHIEVKLTTRGKQFFRKAGLLDFWNAKF